MGLNPITSIFFNDFENHSRGVPNLYQSQRTRKNNSTGKIISLRYSMYVCMYVCINLYSALSQII
jgi:hypothetical protein